MSNKSLRMLKSSVRYYFGYGGSLKGAIKFYMADRDSQRLPARMRKRIICDAYITHNTNTALASILKVDSKILSSMVTTPSSATSIHDLPYGISEFKVMAQLDEVSIKYMYELNNQLVDKCLNNYLQCSTNATSITTSASNLDDTLFNNLAGIDKADDSLC